MSTHFEIPVSRKKPTIHPFKRIHIRFEIIIPKDCPFIRLEIFGQHPRNRSRNLISTDPKKSKEEIPGARVGVVCVWTINELTVLVTRKSKKRETSTHLRFRVCGLRLSMKRIRIFVSMSLGSRDISASSRLHHPIANHAPSNKQSPSNQHPTSTTSSIPLTP